MEPGMITDLTDGEVAGVTITPEFLLLFAILVLIAVIMPFLTLILKDKTNRWTNIILGIVFTALSIIDLKDYLEKQSAYAILLTFAGIVVTALIARYAWKWPKQKNDTKL
jgi:predicted membrane channel-forming protein YqfA (hemolysin III family)